MKKNNYTNNNYKPKQLKLPLEIEKIIEISDPVYSFCEIIDCIDLNSYFVKKGYKTGRPRYNRENLLKVILFSFMENGYLSLRGRNMIIINNSNINNYIIQIQNNIVKYVKELDAYMDAESVYEILRNISSYNISERPFNKYVAFILLQLYKDFSNNDISFEKDFDYYNCVCPILVNIVDDILNDKIII